MSSAKNWKRTEGWEVEACRWLWQSGVESRVARLATLCGRNKIHVAGSRNSKEAKNETRVETLGENSRSARASCVCDCVCVSVCDVCVRMQGARIMRCAC